MHLKCNPELSIESIVNNLYARDSEYRRYKWLRFAARSHPVGPRDGPCHRLQSCCPHTQADTGTRTSAHFPPLLPRPFSSLCTVGACLPPHTHWLYVVDIVLDRCTWGCLHLEWLMRSHCLTAPEFIWPGRQQSGIEMVSRLLLLPVMPP